MVKIIEDPRDVRAEFIQNFDHVLIRMVPAKKLSRKITAQLKRLDAQDITYGVKAKTIEGEGGKRETYIELMK